MKTNEILEFLCRLTPDAAKYIDNDGYELLKRNGLEADGAEAKDKNGAKLRKSLKAKMKERGWELMPHSVQNDDGDILWFMRLIDKDKKLIDRSNGVKFKMEKPNGQG